MKHLFAFISFILLAVAVHAQQIPAKPNPPRLVNDYVKMLTPDQQQALESKLVAYNDSTSTQIAVVIMESIGGDDPGDFATALGREWKVGGKEFNNGVVILITTGGGQGRRHVFIAAGYGLESNVPDYLASQIVNNEMIPQLQAGNYFRAINNAVDAIIKAAAGEYQAPARAKDGGGKGKGSSIFVILIVMFIIIMAISRRGGGGRGGMRRGRSGIPPIIFFPGGGLFGGGGGGGWSGGGGGGGFGGFGGGSFGGGGAGGNW